MPVPVYLHSELGIATTDMAELYGSTTYSRNKIIGERNNIHSIKRGMLGVFYNSRSVKFENTLTPGYEFIGLRGAGFVFATDDCKYSYMVLSESLEVISGLNDEWFGRFPLIHEAVLDNKVELLETHTKWINTLENLSGEERVEKGLKLFQTTKRKCGIGDEVPLDMVILGLISRVPDGDNTLQRLSKSKRIKYSKNRELLI